MMIMTPYALVDSSGFVRQQSRLEESEGPNEPYEISGLQCHKLAGPLDWSAVTAGKRYKWLNGAVALAETETLEQKRARKVDEINTAHTLANVTSFTFAGKEIQANAHSMRQIQMTDMGIRRRGGLRANWRGAWKTLDNGLVAIPDVATWNAFMDAIEDTGDANFGKAQQLKAQTAAAATPEELALIQW